MVVEKKEPQLEEKKKSGFTEGFKERAKNYGFWVSLLSLIPIAFQLFTDYQLPLGEYTEVVNALLGLLVACGVCSNPTTLNKGFLDDK